MKVWYGSFPEVYSDLVMEWMDEVGTSDMVRVNCDETHFRKYIQVPKKGGKVDQVENELHDPNLEGSAFAADNIFGEDRVVLLARAGAWSANDLEYVLNMLDGLSSDVHVAMWFASRGNQFPDDLPELPENLIERFDPEISDQRVGYTDPDEVAEWIVSWMDERGEQMELRDAKRIAHHVGGQIDIIPKLVTVFRAFLKKSPGEQLSYDAVREDLGKLGAPDDAGFGLQNLIDSGDKANALIMCERTARDVDDCMRTIGSLRAVYRRTLAFADDPDMDTKLLMPGNAYYYTQRAQRIGVAKAAEALGIIADTDLKYKSSMDYRCIQEMVISLCELSETKKQSGKRRKVRSR